MYQNAVTYNSTTLPTFSNPPILYNPAVEGSGVMATIAQNEGAQNPDLVHRIAAQAPPQGLYPHVLPRPPAMHPHDALLAAANYLARSDADILYTRNPDYQKVTGPLPAVSDLQNIHYLAQQQAPAKLNLTPQYRKTPPQGVILVQPHEAVLPRFLPQHQGEHLQGPNIATTLPLNALSSSVTPLPMYRQTFVSSPPQEPSNPATIDNLYLTVQQPFVQQSSHRSTPLADFADIAVAHNQGQLFCSNSMLVAPLASTQLQQSDDSGQASQQQRQQATEQSQEPTTEQMHLQDVSSELLASFPKDLLWRPDVQGAALTKMDRESSLPLKEVDFLPLPMAEIHNKSQQSHLPNNQPTDPFIFPVSVPVQCSRDETGPTTSTVTSSYDLYDYSTHMSSYHDDHDHLMQGAINPSKILPNSMSGGNPSGFKSFRQRHHSEGSILKKILHTDVPGLPGNDDIGLAKPDMVAGLDNFLSKTPPLFDTSNVDVGSQSKPPLPISGVKRKSSGSVAAPNPKKQKNEISAKTSQKTEVTKATILSQAAPEEEEIWTVPKHAPPTRTRHRRHSADSRAPYRTGSLLHRPPYLSSFTPQCSSLKSAPTRHLLPDSDPREKRRPPPLIIPPSVNTHSNGGTLYTSHLHHRRRPSGESNSSVGNEKIPPYTPPPMLSPLRFGTGLYHKTPITPSLKPFFRQGSLEHKVIETIPEEEVDEEFLRSAEPKINIGPQYQAVLPDLCPKTDVVKEVHKAELVWKPPTEMQKNNSTQSRHVEEYMKLACSAAVSHGGCNKEFALHLLHKNNGDIFTSVQQILRKKVVVPQGHFMSNYRYTGARKWNQKDRQTFDHAYMHHHKDFFMISQIVKTMSTSDCVDYYYHTIKRRKRRVQRPRRYRNESEGEEVKSSWSPHPDDSDSYQSDDDFMRDHINDPIELKQSAYQDTPSASKSSEVVRRSPKSTAFVKAPQPGLVNPASLTRTPPPALIDYSSVIKREQLAAQQYPRSRGTHTTHAVSTATPQLYNCSVPSCKQSFHSPNQLYIHQQTHKTMKPYLERLNRASPSPASSPGSAASVDADAPQPVFSCPRCGKTFQKVKSRNAHMKTHGKHAQEKRKQKEEEARRKMEEAAAWRNRPQQQRILPPNPPPDNKSILHFHIQKHPGL